jgi:integrase
MKLTPLLEKYVTMMRTGELRTRSGTNYKPMSIKSYNFAFKTYQRYAKSGINLEEFNLTNLSLEEKRAVADKFNRHIDLFIDWMTRQKFSANTRRDVTNILKIVTDYWAEQYFLTLPKVRRAIGVDVPIVTLPIQFVKDFINDTANRYDSMSPEHKYLWELSATILVTSLRVGDAINLSKSDIVMNVSVYLMKENQKTGAMTTLPLPESLYKRYLYNLENHGSVYTPIRFGCKDTFINKNLKPFFATYPEMHEETTYKKADHTGDKSLQSRKFCDIVHPHMLRKTAITTMLAGGVSLDHVRFASGHKSDAIKRYQGWVDSVHKSEINTYYEQFLNA